MAVAAQPSKRPPQSAGSSALHPSHSGTQAGFLQQWWQRREGCAPPSIGVGAFRLCTRAEELECITLRWTRPGGGLLRPDCWPLVTARSSFIRVLCQNWWHYKKPRLVFFFLKGRSKSWHSEFGPNAPEVIWSCSISLWISPKIHVSQPPSSLRGRCVASQAYSPAD